MLRPKATKDCAAVVTNLDAWLVHSNATYHPIISADPMHAVEYNTYMFTNERKQKKSWHER